MRPPHRFGEAAYIKALAVVQDDGRLHYMLAVTYNLQGKIALAREQYRHAVASEEPGRGPRGTSRAGPAAACEVERFELVGPPTLSARSR
jgi:hypothetical protein